LYEQRESGEGAFLWLLRSISSFELSGSDSLAVGGAGLHHLFLMSECLVQSNYCESPCSQACNSVSSFTHTLASGDVYTHMFTKGKKEQDFQEIPC